MNINCSQYPDGDLWTIENDWESNNNVANNLIPMVGDLDGDGVPEIVCFGTPIRDYSRAQKDSIIRVFDGVTKAEKATITMPRSVSGFDAAPYGLVKLANGKGIIVTANYDFYLYAWDITAANPSNYLWKSDQPYGSAYGDWATNVSFADVDNDGNPEILVRNKIFDASNGKLLATATGGSNTGSTWTHFTHQSWTGWKLSSPIAANLLGGDELEIILGNEIYKPVITNHNGTSGNSLTMVKTITPPTGVPADGHAQVADFNLDGKLDILISNRDRKDYSGGKVSFYVWDVENNTVSSTPDITTARSGISFPLIADIDNDGSPEVVIQYGASSTYGFYAYKYNASTRAFTEMWKLSVDEDSYSNGATCFDFNQDGQMEILICDQSTMRIVNGSGKSHKTGNDTTAVYVMSTFDYTEVTIMQYPVIADIDNDGHAEIVSVGSNKLNVFKSAGIPWAPARPVWNQYMYNVTHVNKDLTVPQYLYNNASQFVDPDNSSIIRRPFNNFLQQATTLDNYGRPFYGVADADNVVATGSLNGDSYDVTLTYGNHGATTLEAPYSITVYQGSYGGTILDQKSVSTALTVGSSATASFSFAKSDLCDAGVPALVFAVNDAGTGIAQDGDQQDECDLTNNTYTLTPSITCDQPIDTTYEDVFKCDAYTWPVDGNTYNVSDTYYYTVDATHVKGLRLTISSSINVSIDKDTCDTYHWAATNQDYTATGSYSKNDQSVDGCDSVTTLNLTIRKSSAPVDFTPTDCDSYTWSTLATPRSFSASAAFDTLLTNAAGCDSLVHFSLTLHRSTDTTFTVSACGQYTWPIDNHSYTTSGTYTASIANAAGCDSNATLLLTLSSTVTVPVSKDTCDSYTWVAENNGAPYVRTYTASTIDTVYGISIEGCDSLTILNLTLRHTTKADTLRVSDCDSYTWQTPNAPVYTLSGLYRDTLTNAAGCDSLVWLDLTLNYTTYGTTEQGDGCDTFYWSTTGKTYRGSGIFYDTLTNAAGCDSLVVLQLDLRFSTSAPAATATFCDVYHWNTTDQDYDSTGVYADTLQNSVGCDSLLLLNLTIVHSPDLRVSADTTVDICGSTQLRATGGEVYVFSPSTYLSQSVFLDTVAAPTVTPRSNTNYRVTAYTIGEELVYNGDFALGNVGFTTDHTYLSRVNGYGTYSIGYNASDVSSFAGRDHTTPGNSTGRFMVVDAIAAVDKLVWGQVVQVEPYTDYIFSMWGCSVTTGSPAQLQVYINGVAPSGVFTVPYYASAQGNWDQHYFVWNSGAATEATIRIINHNGSTSNGDDFGIDDISLRKLLCQKEEHIAVGVRIDTTHLNVCDAYTWRETGMTYTESGTYDRHITTRTGCDSLRVLSLNISNTFIDTTVTTACRRFLWRYDSVIYTESGFYSWHTNHPEGDCDTLRFLRLTILDCEDIPLPDNVDEPWCTTPPPANAFAMRELYHCDGVNSMSTPMVGDVDGDGSPEILVCRYSGDPGWGNGILVFDGRDGSLKYTLEVARYTTAGQLMTVADVDKDGQAEFFLLADDGFLYCYSAMGMGMKWRSLDRLDARYLLMSADVNGDGQAEIVAGPYIFDAVSGTLLLHGSLAPTGRGYGAPHTSSGYGRPYYMQALADIDFDGELEFCAGNTVYKPVITNTADTAGNTWQILRQAESFSQIPTSFLDGQTFLADFDNDGDVDVCVIGFGGSGNVIVYVWEGQTNEILAYYRVSMSGIYDGSQTPSIPFAGDLDGNGTPEIIFNFPDGMRAFTWDDTLSNHMRLMHHATRFGETAGFTVFDFNQDGKEEIVYRNTHEMYIVDGTTLTDLCPPITTYSGTIGEYTIVADANGDGNANIIVCHAHGNWFAGANADGKVSVFTSQQAGAWGSARKVWNQWAYSSVNINENLTVPQRQFDIATVFPNGKEPFNGFLRQMPHLDQNGDIYVSVSDLDANAEGSSSASILYSDSGAVVTVSYSNLGDNTIYGPYSIAIYADDYRGELVDTFTVAETLVKNGSHTERMYIPMSRLCHVKCDSLAIVLNDAGTGVAQNGGQQSECDTTNNVIKIPFTPVVPKADTSYAQACDFYIWMAANAVFNYSGMFDDTIPDQLGCDSVRWLNLRIYYSFHDTLDTMACDIMRWVVNRETYTESAVVTEAYQTIHGCDSIHHLKLDMHYRFDTTEYVEACNTFRWEVDHRTYGHSTTHAENMRTIYGCDSVHTLILTVYHTFRDTVYDTICYTDKRAFGGLDLTESGHYTHTVTMMRGCDSIHDLYLQVKEPLPLSIEWTSQCEQLQYTLTAYNPEGDSLTGVLAWSAFPQDGEVYGQRGSATIRVHPTLNTVYTASLSYADGLACPTSASLSLVPTQPVETHISLSTNCLTPEILDFRATAEGSGFSGQQWYIDGEYYSDQKTIGYTYNQFSDVDSVIITLRVNNGYCADSDTAVLHYVMGDLHVPSFFAPAEERIKNFKVQGTGIVAYEIFIYNRWGLLVFHSDDIHQPWDGNLKDGTHAEQAAYVYTIRYRTIVAPDELKTKTGTVTLLR